MTTFQNAVDISIDVSVAKLSADIKSVADELSAFDGIYSEIDALCSNVRSFSSVLTAIEDDMYDRLEAISDAVAVSVDEIYGNTILAVNALDSKLGISADSLSTMIVLSTAALSGKMVVISGEASSLDAVVGTPCNN